MGILIRKRIDPSEQKWVYVGGREWITPSGERFIFPPGKPMELEIAMLSPMPPEISSPIDLTSLVFDY